MDAEQPKKHSLRTIINEFMQDTMAIRELYKSRARWEGELLADQVAGPLLLDGGKIEHNGTDIWLEFLDPDDATIGERRSLAKGPDGSFLKIRVKKGGTNHARKRK